MIFINRENTTVDINGRITFKQFMDKGFEGFVPTLEDWKLHSNLFFPEVRLRNFIEIRNHDCVGGGLEYSIPALYKGIMYDSNAMSEVKILLGKYYYREINELRYNVAKYGIHSKIRGIKVRDICQNLVEIAHYSLKSQGRNEEEFLEEIS